ncbi:hypothetical protein ACQEVF_21075 [Nonomuraea polychroma]|uniref:hypothetical protein n=1 Tax=Nonomuraea polychroma TaxID=46176 RepID=UPI003D89D002
MTHDHRTALINGLLGLAAFLQDHPDVPTPRSLTLHHFPRQDSDAEQCAEIDQIAARIEAPITYSGDHSGHYATSRFFGPVEYRAVAILAAARARYDAETTYRGCIEPDPVPATR